MPISQGEKVRAIEEARSKLVNREPELSPARKRSITLGQFVFFAVLFAAATYLPITFMLLMT
jgi:hypothetical protein